MALSLSKGERVIVVMRLVEVFGTAKIRNGMVKCTQRPHYIHAYIHYIRVHMP